jgi:hypothetical protein
MYSKDSWLEDPVCVWRYPLIGPILQDEPPNDLLAQDHHNVFQHAHLLIIAAFGMQINGGATGGYFYNNSGGPVVYSSSERPICPPAAGSIIRLQPPLPCGSRRTPGKDGSTLRSPCATG